MKLMMAEVLSNRLGCEMDGFYCSREKQSEGRETIEFFLDLLLHLSFFFSFFFPRSELSFSLFFFPLSFFFNFFDQNFFSLKNKS